MTPHEHHPGCGCDAAATAPAQASANPIAVEVTRGGVVESRHRARGCVVDADGRVLHAWGDVEEPVFPRSAVKAVQAVPFVETGAWARFGLTDRELALACSSHNGERVHSGLARSWMERIGQPVAAYECGTHWPMDEATTHAMLRAGEEADPTHNNCSGKHAGMITTAVHMGEPVRGYTGRDHPVQRRIEATLTALSGEDASRAPVGVDGCSVPNWGVSLRAFATAMARFADPSGEPPARAAAMRTIAAAWAAHPYLVAGRGRFDTLLMNLFPGGAVLSKGGAEGVHVVVVPGRRLALAVKADDGAGRAADAAAAAVLRMLGVGTDAEWESPAGRALLAPEQKNRAGLVTGVTRPAEGWARA
jgi:L-asparaginase II